VTARGAMEEATIASSRYSFADTVARLTKAIVDAGNTIFADIDQSAAAKSVGLELRPTRLLVFGNPSGGTGLMKAFPLVALDLPLKLLAWEENGKVQVGYTPLPTIAERYGVTGKDAQIGAMGRAVASIVASAT
jgi:uncharacterized protein (DUF302 family)